MLYGSELIGFQKLHAELMQCVINIAVKWIVGLARSNTSTDAFTLCYELGLPPIFLEMSTSRAQLGLKLNAPKKMKTWIQNLWDMPATYNSRHMTWVSQTKKWIDVALKEKHKYVCEFIPVRGTYHLEGRRIVEDDDTYGIAYEEDAAAPLRHWAQLGWLLEMRIRASGYRSDLMEKIQAEMVGEFADGALVETSLESEAIGELHLWWDPAMENLILEWTVTGPVGRTREEYTKLLIIRHVVLERLMTSQKTVGWDSYDSYHFGITRGYLREAVGRTDLSEGVKACRLEYLEQKFVHLTHVKARLWESAMSTLLSGIIRLQDFTQESQGWFDLYQLGFGHFRLVTPGFTAHQGFP
ncbi:hypothetical protein EDB89DRAFT_1910012 [Lactarius sanguifluus]|nr:hypothetical protein EDB89DRAFT_1910012 [Lactarius sanguifluus]